MTLVVNSQVLVLVLVQVQVIRKSMDEYVKGFKIV